MPKVSFTSSTAAPGESPDCWHFSSVGCQGVSASPWVWGVPCSNLLLSLLSQSTCFLVRHLWRLATEGRTCGGNSQGTRPPEQKSGQVGGGWQGQSWRGKVWGQLWKWALGPGLTLYKLKIYLCWDCSGISAGFWAVNHQGH